MERLTYSSENVWEIKGADGTPCDEVCENRGISGCCDCPIQMAFDRLAAYEDAMPIERAQELAGAERDGRLVVLPEGTESMIMAGFVAKGNEMVYPVMETKGDPEFIPAILSLMIDAVSAANGISYNMLLSALIDNPPVTTCKQDAGGKAAAALKKREEGTK